MLVAREDFDWQAVGGLSVEACRGLPYPVILLASGSWEVLSASPAARALLGVDDFEKLSERAREGLTELELRSIQANVWGASKALMVHWRRAGHHALPAVAVSQSNRTWLLCLNTHSNAGTDLMVSADALTSVLELLPVAAWWQRAPSAPIEANSFSRLLPACQVPGGREVCSPAMVAAAGCGRMSEGSMPVHLSFSLPPPPGVRFMSRTVNLGRCGNWKVMTYRQAGDGLAALTVAYDERQAGVGAEAETQTRELLRELSSSRQHVREEVRAEVAREVHDHLGQELTVLRLALGQLQQQAREKLPADVALQQQIDRVAQQTGTVMQTARRIAYELRTDVLMQKGLLGAITDYVLQVEVHSAMRCRLEVAPGWVEPDATMSRHLYRSVQELLNNVVKHAAAERTLVHLSFVESAYILEVRDDGVGFPAAVLAEKVGADHIGLRSLRERAALYGGTLAVRTRPEVDGSLVRIHLPERRASRRPSSVAKNKIVLPGAGQ